MRLDLAAAHPDAANQLLIAVLQDLYNKQEAVWLAPHAVLHMQTRWWELKGKLRPAWDIVSTWRMIRAVRSRIPNRLEIVRALSYVAVINAMFSQPKLAPRWRCFAAISRFCSYGPFRLRRSIACVSRMSWYRRRVCSVASAAQSLP